MHSSERRSAEFGPSVTDVVQRARALMSELETTKDLSPDKWTVLAKYVNELHDFDQSDVANRIMEDVTKMGRGSSLQEHIDAQRPEFVEDKDDRKAELEEILRMVTKKKAENEDDEDDGDYGKVSEAA